MLNWLLYVTGGVFDSSFTGASGLLCSNCAFQGLHPGDLFLSGIVLRSYGRQNVRNVLNSNPVLILVCPLRIGPKSEAFLEELKAAVLNRPVRTMPVKMASSLPCPYWNALGQACALPW